MSYPVKTKSDRDRGRSRYQEGGGVVSDSMRRRGLEMLRQGRRSPDSSYLWVPPRDITMAEQEIKSRRISDAVPRKGE